MMTTETPRGGAIGPHEMRSAPGGGRRAPGRLSAITSWDAGEALAIITRWPHADRQCDADTG